MQEIWKPYKTQRKSQWGTYYVVADIEISNFGNVRGKKWKCKEFTKDTVKIIGGRRCVGNKSHLIYQLVDRLFRGPLPKGYCVHHKDGNKLNDNLDNLERMPIPLHLKLHAKENWSKEEIRQKFLKNLNPHVNKGKHHYNNGEIEVFAFECPEGFILGRIKINKQTCKQ